MRVPSLPLILLALGWALFAASPAAADPAADAARLSASGLEGLDRTAWPAPRPLVGVAGGVGYGITESLPAAGDGDAAHHRFEGTLAAGLTPKLRYVSVALRLDGRLDYHPPDRNGTAHVTGVGDPRLFVRGGYPLSDELQLGADATVWVPGRTAPSIDWRATTTDFRVLGAYEPAAVKGLSLLAAAGYRLDYSARAAPDLTRLRTGDRISLGLSGADAVLIALGASYPLPRDFTLFGEFSADLLVGAGAPDSMAESPMRVVVGARHPLGRLLMGELSATVAASKRPGITPDDPLVPIEPRFTVRFGVRFGHSLAPPEAEPVVEAPPPPPEPVAPQFSSVSGQVLDEQGRTLPDAVVTLTLADGSTREALTDAEGRYRFDEVPLGPAKLGIVSLGFATQEIPVEVTTEPFVDPARSLEPREPQGTLRGLTRSFASEPIAATVVVTDARGRRKGKADTDAEGRFELVLPPGEFKVRISARGYTSQRRTIVINDNGVTVLNVDLRERK